MLLFETILYEFILGYIMQGLVFVLGIFAFNRQKIVLKDYLFVSAILIVFSFLMRVMGINFGVHIILNLLMLFLLSVILLKMPIYPTIRSTLFVTVLLLASEMTNVALMISLYGKTNFEAMMEVPLQKAILGLPGGFIFALLSIIAYIVLVKNKKEKE